MPMAYDGVYAASKVFERYQFDAIRIENMREHKGLDFFMINPQYVMTNNARLQAQGLVETP